MMVSIQTGVVGMEEAGQEMNEHPPIFMEAQTGQEVNKQLVVVDAYATAEIVQLSQMGSELDDALDNQIPGQTHVAFEVSRETADSPIKFGWTRGTHPQTIYTPIAQKIILSLIGPLQ